MQLETEVRTGEANPKIGLSNSFFYDSMRLKQYNMITQKYLDELTYEIIGSAIEVHKIMGRGLLESIYHQCMKEELAQRKINFSTEMKVPLIYKTKELKVDFKCDLFIENCLVVELKSVIQSYI